MSTKNIVKHDVYDAESRSKPIDLPISLKKENSTSNKHLVTRRELDLGKDEAGHKSKAFILDNLLTKEECKELIENIEKVGFEGDDIANEYPSYYRNNQRLITILPELADSLWKRVRAQLNASDIENVTPYGWATEGIWLPTRLNECFLISKYNPKSFFKPHYDGMYKNRYGECSAYSLTIYLNDDFKGGQLSFRTHPQKSYHHSYIPNDTKIITKYTPVSGSAVLFNHDTLHEGLPVESGVKYILRTSIMLHRVCNLSDPQKKYQNDPKWLNLRDVFRSFDELLANENPKDFTTTYLELQKLQLEKRGCINELVSTNAFPLPRNIIATIFSSLSLKDVSSSALVCKQFLVASRDSLFWKNKYIENWNQSKDDLKFIESMEIEMDPSLQNWWGIFKHRYIRERDLYPPFVILVNESEVFYSYKSEEGNDTSRAVRSDDPWDQSFDSYVFKETGNSFIVTTGNTNFEHLGAAISRYMQLADVDHLSCPVLLITYPNLYIDEFMSHSKKDNKSITDSNSNSNSNSIPSTSTNISVSPYGHFSAAKLENEFEYYAQDFSSSFSVADAGLCALYYNNLTSGNVFYVSEYPLLMCSYVDSKIVEGSQVLFSNDSRVQLHEIENVISKFENKKIFVVSQDKTKLHPNVIQFIEKELGFTLVFMKEDLILKGGVLFASITSLFASSHIYPCFSQLRSD